MHQNNILINTRETGYIYMNLMVYYGCYCYLMNENEIYYGAIVESTLYGVGHIVCDTIIKVHYGMNE